MCKWPPKEALTANITASSIGRGRLQTVHWRVCRWLLGLNILRWQTLKGFPSLRLQGRLRGPCLLRPGGCCQPDSAGFGERAPLPHIGTAHEGSLYTKYNQPSKIEMIARAKKLPYVPQCVSVVPTRVSSVSVGFHSSVQTFVRRLQQRDKLTSSSDLTCIHPCISKFYELKRGFYCQAFAPSTTTDAQ
jgi:hypothetical protein